VKPIPRHAANLDLSRMVVNAGLKNTTEVVDYFIRRFMRVAPAEEKRQALISFLNKQLGTTDVSKATTYMEDPLRLFLHLLLSEPEYQLS
jgi:glutamate/tyrosine decarboxylase-like PLP-dependent enzyme